jgi:hypothetical protein
MLYLFFILVMLSACSPREAPLRLQPMDEAAVEVAKIIDVRVEMVQGPALPMAKLLSSAIAVGLVNNGVTTSIKPNEASRFVLKGRAEANWENPRVPFVMLIYWTLYDATGKAIGTYTQGVRGARWKWEFGDPQIIHAVGNGAAKPLAAMIVEEEENPLPILLLLVNPVIGAPGDGNEALRLAIIKALRASDVTITEDSRQASLKLTGQVALQPLANSLDKVLVIWRVQTMDGFEVGRATQENNILTGKLDGVWGDEAEKIAEAALIGIERIIGSGKTRSAPSIKDTIGGPAPTPDLEQVPGRAPPPPK